jgi:hypothetical protein
MPAAAHSPRLPPLLQPLTPASTPALNSRLYSALDFPPLLQPLTPASPQSLTPAYPGAPASHPPDIPIPFRHSHSQRTFSALDSPPLLSPRLAAFSVIDSRLSWRASLSRSRHSHSLAAFSFPPAILIPDGHSHSQPPFSLHRHTIAMNRFYLSKLKNEKPRG